MPPWAFIVLAVAWAAALAWVIHLCIQATKDFPTSEQPAEPSPPRAPAARTGARTPAQRDELRVRASLRPRRTVIALPRDGRNPRVWVMPLQERLDTVGHPDEQHG